MELSTHQDVHEAIGQAGAEVMKLTSYVCALAEPALLISYEKALRNAEHVIEAMIAFCRLTPSHEQKAAALGTILPDSGAYIWATQVVFRGHVDNIQGNILRGWCCYRDSSDVVEIEVCADGKNIGIFPANEYRDDLKNFGIHIGFHAFNIDLTAFSVDSSTLLLVCPAGHALALPNSGHSVEELRGR
jgi:hypothetical protein